MTPGGLDDTGIAATTLRPDEVHSLPEPALLQTVLEASRAIERLEALRVAAVAEIDERAVSLDTLGFRSVKHWLAANTLLEVPAAARILALGKALRREPEIADAFNNGTVSAEHAALITKFCETPPRGMPDEALDACRNVLLDAATRPAATTATDRTCISKLERMFESDELPPSEDTERNEFHASQTLNGRVAVKGDLDTVTGEMLLTALSSLTKPRNPLDDPAGPRTPAQRRADAFAEILRSYLDSGAAPVEGGEKPHLFLHVNASDLARTDTDHRSWNTGNHPNQCDGASLFDESNPFGTSNPFGDNDTGTGIGKPDIATMPWMGPLSIATALRLACDCHLTPSSSTTAYPSTWAAAAEPSPRNNAGP